MAAEGGKIEYKDLVSPDDSILELLIQLEQLNKSYGTMITAIRAGAKEIVYAMKQTSGATSEGRAQIDEATAAASRLERAEKELKFALSDTGKQVAWLKAQTADANKVSVEHARQVKALAGSYEKIKSDLNDNIKLWKSLSEAERMDAEMGGQVLESIIGLKGQLAELDATLKPTVTRLTELQKAEQRLAYLQSEEGQRLIEIKKQISEILSGRKTEKAEIDEVARAYEKLSKAKSDENIKIQELNQQTSEANRIAKLTAQLNNAATGSYNQLSAQYQLNKIKLNAMSAEERNATEAGKALEEQTLRIYKEMIHLQEATGNHRLSVGNYAKTWDGLGNSVNQVIREIPSAAVGLNTFFLAISNNIPIVIDEIQRLKEKNEMLRAEGRPTKNIIGSIVSSIFSWQTALILCLTALSMHGKEIINWIEKLIKGADATMTETERLEALQDELEKTNGSYGQNIVTLKKLQSEWQNLSTKKEQLQWIRDNEAEFKKLDISITSVTDAENVFVENTEAVIEALRLRAKAAAATKLASEKYEQALIKRNEVETKGGKYDKNGKLITTDVKTDWLDRSVAATAQAGASRAGIRPGGFEDIAKSSAAERIKSLNAEADAAEKDGDAYFDLAAGLEEQAKARLKAAKIEGHHRTPKKRPKGPKGRQPRDLTDTINRNDITLQKKYEESITKLQRDEYIKRRKAAVDATLDANRQLTEQYRKNEEYVKNTEGKYKQLTDAQKKQIAQQQKWVNDTIANNLEQLKFELEQIEKERQINSLRILRETINWELGAIEKSVRDEQAIKLEQLKQEEELVKKTNATVAEGGRSEAEITAEFAKKRQQIIAEYDKIIYEMRQKDIQNQLELVKKGSQKELDLLLQQNEIARQLALAENRAKPAAQQQSKSSINKSFDKKAQTITGRFKMTGFDEAQAEAEATFNIIKHNETEITKFKLQQEKERWEKQIALAKSGALEWSDAQIRAAEATVKGLERQIKEASSTINLIGEKGLGGALLTKLGFDDDQISALEDAANIVLDNIKAIFDAEVELAEMEVEKAKERVDAAQSAYDAEIEARNNGYANNVATAKKELQLEKKNQLEKEKLLEEAKKRQEAVNSVIQASSLITASANLWSSFSSIPIVGPALAIAAIAAMWSSFAFAKIKAAQVTKAASQEYGEGGLEFLEGGSHASGNDIDLATRNSKGKNMRAEGGEAMAIINKRSTRRYRRQLPGIIDSLNKCTFEDKYLRAFESGETLQAQISQSPVLIDLSRLEQDVTEIKKQNATRYYQMGDTTLIVKGNVKRYIRQ